MTSAPTPGLDTTDMDMIRRDMLGAKLGAKAAAYIESSAAEIEGLRKALEDETAFASRLRAENEQLRWRGLAVLPDWNDLPQSLRTALVDTAGFYAAPYYGGDFAVNYYAELRKEFQRDPAALNPRYLHDHPIKA